VASLIGRCCIVAHCIVCTVLSELPNSVVTASYIALRLQLSLDSRPVRLDVHRAVQLVFKPTQQRSQASRHDRFCLRRLYSDAEQSTAY